MESAEPLHRPPGNWQRRVLRWSITLVVVAVVLWFAGDTVRQGWNGLSRADFSLDWSWVALSAVLYVLSLAPQAYYLKLALRALGESPPRMAIVRSYYLGHLGKYVPGKALVAVLRTGILVNAGCRMRPVLVAVFLETLTLMATGGILAAVLLVTTGDGPPTFAWLAAGLGVVVTVPIAPPIARQLARRVVHRRVSEGNATEVMSLVGVNWRLTFAGVVCSTVAWTVMALSLWSAARAVEVELATVWSELYVWMESVTLPVVAGFLSLIPGGAVVRDMLQAELLSPTLGKGTALVVAALWRVISVVSEGFSVLY